MYTTQTPQQPRPTGDRRIAIAMLLVAVALFSCLDASAKYLATVKNIPVSQIVWLRFIGQIILIIALIGPHKISWLLDSKAPTTQLWRSVLMVLTTLFNFLALKYLRLDQTVTIMFLAPLLVALLSGPLLGEWVGWHRLAAIIVGFAGVLIVIRPGYLQVHPAIGFAIAAMVVMALFTLLTRHIAGRDAPMVTLFYSMLAGSVLGAPIALAEWVWPTELTTWVMLACLGALGGAGHYLFILAHDRAPAAVIAPFFYSQIISMVILGYLVFDDLPDTATIAGATIVIASGLYLYHREQRGNLGS